MLLRMTTMIKINTAKFVATYNVRNAAIILAVTATLWALVVAIAYAMVF